jgi:hypothetical protein
VAKAVRKALEARKHGIRKIASICGVGVGTVQRIKAEALGHRLQT